MDSTQIRKDRMRYTKNTFSSSFTYLAILANVFYFVSIYKSDVGTYYYTWLIGVSIIYNLLFMMISFLCSEGVKNYHFGYSVALIVVGGLQFARIFIIPMRAIKATITVVVGTESVEKAVMHGSQFTFVLACLLISGGFCILAGVVGIWKYYTLNAYLKEIGAEA